MVCVCAQSLGKRTWSSCLLAWTFVELVFSINLYVAYVGSRFKPCHVLYGKYFDLLSHDACPSDNYLCTILLHILDNFHFSPHFLSVFAVGQRQMGSWLHKAASQGASRWCMCQEIQHLQMVTRTTKEGSREMTVLLSFLERHRDQKKTLLPEKIAWAF